MTATVSLLGIYMVRGETKADDVFYYRTDEPDYWMMVPQPSVLRPSKVHRPVEDRAEWIAVGSYHDDNYDVVIDERVLASHIKRIISAWDHEVKRAKHNQAATSELLTTVTQERNRSRAYGEHNAELAAKHADQINRIYDILQETL